MCNVGKELARKLESVGIRSAEELTRAGSMEAFLRLKIRYPNVCLVHLYALQGAIDQTAYNCLPETVKEELKRFSDSLRERS